MKKAAKVCVVGCALMVAGMASHKGYAQATSADPATEHVIVVMSDGLRWQDVFRGADPALLIKENNAGQPVEELKAKYVKATPEESRKALMPFLWSVMVPQGEIYGNRDKGSDAFVTNGLNFSYPGYSETLTGHPDNARIKSNDNIPNPNVTVLEWLDRGWKKDDPVAHDLTAAFGAWEVIGGIVNQQRCGFTVNVGYQPFTSIPMTPKLELINQLKAETPKIFPDESFDAPTFYTTMEYLKVEKPKLLFLSLGETDDWAHANRIGFYLESATRVDDYLKRLWEFLQSESEYRGHTTMLFLPDHGRGGAPTGWQSHGEKLPESRYTFFAAMGVGVPVRGELGAGTSVSSNQVAATIARLFGKDWDKETPAAGKPIAEIR